MIVCGIDPGPTDSAFVLWDGDKILEYGNTSNGDLLLRLEFPTRFNALPDRCAIEQIRGFGILASDGLFDTCHYTGRFLQAFGEDKTTMIPRKEVSRHICGSSGISHDKFIREALITRFGGKDIAIGKKKNVGPLYGIAGHTWAALAVAITWWDLSEEMKEL